MLTSNCLIEPQRSYKGRIFTAGPVGWPGVRHIENGDFTPVVQAAQALPGFTQDAPEKTTTIGFARDTVMGVAGTVIDAVKSGRDPPVLPDRRLRWRRSRPQLLHRSRGSGPRRLPSC